MTKKDLRYFLKEIKTHAAGINDMAMTPDCSRLLTVSLLLLSVFSDGKGWLYTDPLSTEISKFIAVSIVLRNDKREVHSGTEYGKGGLIAE